MPNLPRFARRVAWPLLGAGILGLAGCVPPPAPGVALTGTPQAYASANCYAGFYQCVLPAAQQAGTPCACPGLGAPSYGVVR